ncbi:hypothetical protein GCM10008965_20170 [Methylorubrum aminovorans]
MPSGVIHGSEAGGGGALKPSAAKATEVKSGIREIMTRVSWPQPRSPKLSWFLEDFFEHYRRAVKGGYCQKGWRQRLRFRAFALPAVAVA